MKKLVKTTIALVLMLCVILGPAVMAAPEGGVLSALRNSVVMRAEAAGSGKCGDSVNWSLASDGTLTLTGTGRIYDWTDASTPPWYSSRS